jgi:hypothetical protein
MSNSKWKENLLDGNVEFFTMILDIIDQIVRGTVLGNMWVESV